MNFNEFILSQLGSQEQRVAEVDAVIDELLEAEEE